MKISISQLEQENSLFVDLNNDINRILRLLDSSQELKKLLKYITKDASLLGEVEESLIGKTINASPLVPLDHSKDDEASYVYCMLLTSTRDPESNTFYSDLAIDVFTPLDRWAINEGVRPYMIGHIINDLMKTEYKQTGGAKYELSQVLSVRMDDELIGIRLVYGAIHEN